MSNIKETEKTRNIALAPSTIETVDAAFYEYVENINLFCNTISGWTKIPVIWSSAERSYQIKNNKEIRDKNGSLIPLKFSYAYLIVFLIFILAFSKYPCLETNGGLFTVS